MAGALQRRVVDKFLPHVDFLALAAFLSAFFFTLKSELLLTHHAGQEIQVRCFDNAVIVAKTCSYFFLLTPRHSPLARSTV